MTHRFNKCSTCLWVLLAAILLSACTTPSIMVTQEQQAGDNYFNQNNYPEALIHYTNMLDASLKLGVYRNLTMEADVHRKIANCYEMTGKYSLAEKHVKLALVNDSIENNMLNIIEDHRMIGKIDLYRGNNFDAIKSFEKALALSEGMDQSIKNLNKNAIAENHLALGQLYATMGRFNESLSQTGISLDLFRETGNRQGEMEALLAMASVYYNYGDLDISKSLTESSLAMVEVLELSSSRHLNNLARISATLGEYEDALRYQEMALASANQSGIAAQRIWFTIRLGDLYRDLGDRKRSIEYYNRARALKDNIGLESAGFGASLNLRAGDLLSAQSYFLAQGSDIGTGISLIRLAEIAVDNGETDRALNYLNSAEEIFSGSGHRLGTGNTLLQQGIALSNRNEPGKALSLFDQLVELEEFPEIQWQAYYQRGLIFENQDNLSKARDSYLESIKIIEEIRGGLTIDEFKSSFISNKIDVYDRLIGVSLKLGQSLQALEYTERAKARSFFEMLANKRINNPDNKGDSLIVQEQEKRFEIQQLYKQLQTAENIGVSGSGTRELNRRNLTTELENKQEEHRELLLKLKLFNPEYAEIVSFTPTDYQELREGIIENTAILTYWISDQATHIWLISGDEIINKSYPISNTDLIKTITDVRTHIATNATLQAREELKQLYRILIGPVSDRLADVGSLIIVPNKGLHFLPFQALIDESDNYFINSLNISYEPSLSVHNLKQQAQVLQSPTFFGAALSDLAVGLNVGLPGTEDELKRILPLFNSNLSSFGEESTETFVKENIGNYNFIHLATHGIFNFEQPVYSFLLFPPNEIDDGRLTVYEVMELELNSKLVTLSACETGLGYLDRGDEIVGLSRSFLYAGSSAVIVSLWSVADYQTSLLMSKFYSYINDHSLEEALAIAQREVMKEYPNPFFWSPFILIGKGN